MPRFAILEHDHPALHWDLLLEAGDACRTWRLASPPASGEVIAAEAIADHRLMYLDYAGPVSGDRGTVTQWDFGQFVWIKATDDEVCVLLAGRRISGRLTLNHTDLCWHASLREMPFRA